MKTTNKTNTRQKEIINHHAIRSRQHPGFFRIYNFLNSSILNINEPNANAGKTYKNGTCSVLNCCCMNGTSVTSKHVVADAIMPTSKQRFRLRRVQNGLCVKNDA